MEKVPSSPNQYWHSFYRFPRPEQGKGSIVSLSSTGKSFRFTSPILEKGSIGYSVPYCVKVVYVLKSNTGKRFLVPQTSTEIGSLGSPDQYW